MSKSRYTLLIVALLMTVMALLSVSSLTAQDEYVDECLAPAAEATEAMEVPDNSDISFEIILPNARGDRSFIDSAAAGAERAIAELGVDGVIIETQGSQEHDAAVRRAIQDAPNIVITIAVDSSIIGDMLDEFPDQLFGAQETFFFPEPPDVPNLSLYNILTHENSYLAGIAAGMLTAPTVSFEINVTNYAAAVEKAFSDDPIYFLTNHLPPPEQSTLWGAPVAQDGIAIITYPGSSVNNLTTEQLRAIYQGRITNWASLSGERMAITVISREDGSGTRAEFERLVMGERQTTQTAQIAPSSSAAIASVARQPGSIGYVSIGYLNESVQPISINGAAPTQANVSANLYPLRTTLFVAGPGEPEGALRAFVAWAQSPDGQAVVGRRYSPLLES